VLGVCNGFQILLEAGLLPGALMRNVGLSFICRTEEIVVGTDDSPFTAGYARGQRLRIPVAHHDGNYVADAGTLARLQDDDRIAFRYAGEVNGSVGRVAGILSPNRRILGMMPHPERAADPLLGSADGSALFAGLVGSLEGAA
jgi:phosphoribosylformylglycinamidine synthase